MAKKLVQTKLKNDPGFYLFYNIDLKQIPKEARGKFIEIYQDYYKNPGDTQPTPKTLLKAFKLAFADPKNLSKKDLDIVKSWSRSEWYSNLMKDATKEFERAKDYRMIGLFKKVIFIEHLIRHKSKVSTINKVSRLRCKVRKAHGLDRNARVGF